MRSMTQMCRERFLLIAVTVAAIGGGCNREKNATTPAVALVVKTLNNAFFIEMEKGARAAADSLGLKLEVQAPEVLLEAHRWDGAS